MPRSSPSELNDEIVDHAAALFARHGFAHTSLQQIADAVGYTKAGLLHHFASKQAIYDAVVSVVSTRLGHAAAGAEGLPPGKTRDLAVVTALVDLTLTWPGASQFGTSLVHDSSAIAPELAEAGLALLDAFGGELDADRLIRIASACSGLTVTSVQATGAGLGREWRDLIISTSMNTLGH